MPVAALSKKDSTMISYLKAMAVFLVILGHCFSYYSRTHELSTALRLIVKLINYVHVPTFFILSGFLCHKQKVSFYYKKKLFRILIPFWFFAFLKLLYSNLISDEFAHADTLLMQIYDALIVGRVYWFAYAICVIFLIAPLFWERDESRGPAKAVIGLVLSVTFNILYCGLKWDFLPNTFQIGNVVFYLPFFLSGYIIRHYYDSIKKWVVKFWKEILLVSLTAIAGVSILYIENISTNPFAAKYISAFALLGFLVLLSEVLPESIKLLHIAGDDSWQLMLLDAFYKAVIFAIVMRFVSVTPIMVLLIAVLDFLFGILTCIIAEKIPVLRSLMGL